MTLEQSKNPSITVAQEIESLKLYLSLESLRFSDQFDLDIHTAPELDIHNTLIPSCILQPLVENSIWHGLLNKKTKGKLLVRFKVDNNRTICIVDDNGHGDKRQTVKTNHESTGLLNLKERIDLINKGMREQISFTISSSMFATETYPGFRVEISIPNELNKHI